MDYFKDTKYISNSMLKAFQNCPFFYQEKYINKTVVEIEHDYFVYGSAVDVLLTEKEGEFEKQFLPIDRKIDVAKLPDLRDELKKVDAEVSEKQLNEKPHKQLSDKKEKLLVKIGQIEQAEDKEQMTTSMFTNVVDSVKELERQELYNMFEVKDFAQEIICLEGAGNMPPLKGKLDYFNKSKKILADVKTTANITTFNPRMYCQQLSFYRALAGIKYGIPEEEIDCYLLVVDKMATFKRSEIFHLSGSLLDMAREEYLRTIEEFMECKESGIFPACTMNNPDARREKCYNCDNYPNCPFSIQKEITKIN